ncbi:uncharacterized protein LOC130737994 [Lotus japonicus]|uniref:uncharacterized protein LOC130737994 n=1 Tax=Lotus japonicus TaxID=34305 RepID=UPI0025853A0D|nr:uncharacterized protein LOC130737994 [Lotus japonicus]
MAEETSPSPPPQPSQFHEVNCRISGKTWRFAVGTDAGFAVSLINRKLKGSVPVVVSHIEAVKNGEEEPIAFGPNAVLSNFGEAWKLHTVPSEEVRNGHVRLMATQTPGLVSGFSGDEKMVFKPISFHYGVKIVFAFILIFVLGAIFTLFLDNLPALILYVKSIV